MKKGRFSEEQIIGILKRHEAGQKVTDLAREDGISETTDPAELEFGAKRFRQFLETEQSTSADQLADRLLQELSAWSARGTDQDLNDDITMVALHVAVN